MRRTPLRTSPQEINMDYINGGGFLFEGYEDDIVFVYLWEKMIIDVSFWGRIEFIFRILFARPPKRYYEAKDILTKPEPLGINNDHRDKTEDEMTYKIEVVKGKKQWYWRIMHRNGNILAHSETYSSREKAVRTAKNLHQTFKRNTCGFSII